MDDSEGVSILTLLKVLNERMLRESMVQRRIMGCFRNGKGTWIYETVMTVLSTWKQQGLDIPQTLAQTLTQEWNKS